MTISSSNHDSGRGKVVFHLLSNHHHIRFWYLWCCGCPDSGVGNTWQRLTLVLHEFLSDGLTPSRLHIVISFLTHADHVFLGLPRSLVPGSPKRVMELMHEMARCTYPYHPKTPSAKNSRDLVYIQFLEKHKAKVKVIWQNLCICQMAAKYKPGAKHLVHIFFFIDHHLTMMMMPTRIYAM